MENYQKINVKNEELKQKENREIPLTTYTDVTKEASTIQPPSPDKLDSKDNPTVKAEKEKTLKEKILGLFETKPISEITDPNKLEKTLKADIDDLHKIKTYTLNFTNTNIFTNLAKKYNLDRNPENIKLAEDLQELVRIMGKMEKGKEKVKITEDYNYKYLEFTTKMNEQYKNRMNELKK